MGAESIFSYATLFGFLFTLARVSGVFAFLPLASIKAAPVVARIVLSLAITLMLRADWRTPVGADATIGRIVAGLAAEAGLGLAIGVSISILFEVFQMAAQAASLQAGLGYASTIDPTSGADSTVLLTTAQLTAGLLFFVSGADRLMVKALAESLRLLPPESFTLHQSWATAIVQFAAAIFSSGLRLAAPLIALLLLADASLAILGRVQPQLHLISLTMPLKLAATMLVLSVTIVLQPGFFESLLTTWTRAARRHTPERAMTRSLHYSPAPTRSSVALWGGPPRSPADALVGFLALDRRVRGDPRGPGGPPHNMPAEAKCPIIPKKPKAHRPAACRKRGRKEISPRRANSFRPSSFSPSSCSPPLISRIGW